jgi:hypothetical protein
MSSCVKQETGQHQIEYFMDLDLQADSDPVRTHIFEKRIASSWVKFLQENNIDPANVKAVRPRFVILSQILGNVISYDVVDESHVSVYPPNDRSQELPIAEIFNPSGDPEELNYLPGLADVKEIIGLPEFILRLSLHLKATPGSLSEHRLTVQFDIYLN